MLKTVRSVLFWLHLCLGLAAGLVILVMSVTGAALAFKPQLLAWSERELRTVAPGPTRLPLEDVVARAREVKPGARPTALTVQRAPDATVLVAFGREGAVHVDPSTGAARLQGEGGMRGLLHVMEDLHRWLALEGAGRDTGKAVTGASNLVFLFLALSGLWLWWPRRWGWRAVRPSVVPRVLAGGKARDWSLHTALGFWALPVLVVLTLSGVVISYRWASDAVFRVTGSPVPPPQQGGPGAPPSVALPPHPEGARPLPHDALLARVQAEVPAWGQVTLRLGGGAPGAGAARGPGAGAPRGPQVVGATVKEQGAWPPFASTTLALDPIDGAVLERTGWADASAGRRARLWLRFLHTGEALGWPGQLAAGLACLVGAVLVYSGVALALRRFVAWRRRRRTGAPTLAPAGDAPEAPADVAA